MYKARSNGFMRNTAIAIFAACAAILVLYLRRSTTLTVPQVWAEDGVVFIPQFFLHGWSSLWIPINGYLAIIPRFFTALSITFAPHHYPFASTLLAWIFISGVAVYISIAPTMLSRRLWVALSCFLIATDAEVFATSLYSFWWAGVILLLLPFWEKKPSYFGMRAATLIVCGLSSPMVTLIAPLMGLRAFWLKNKVEVRLFVVTFICVSVQLWFYKKSNSTSYIASISGHTFQLLIEKFFGRFIFGPWTFMRDHLFISGLGVLSISILALVHIRNRWVTFGLVYLLSGAIILTAVRVPIEIIDPILAGPRYFFYPFVVLNWILIEGLWSNGRFKLTHGLVAFLLISTLINATRSGWSRDHEDLSWNQHLASCVHFQRYSIPVQFNGESWRAWKQPYSRENCQILFDPKKEVKFENLFPFTFRGAHEAVQGKDPIQIYTSNKKERSHSPSAPKGFKVIGLLSAGDSQSKSLKLGLKRGTRLLYSGSQFVNDQQYLIKTATDLKFSGQLPACVDWCTLEFSSDLLPESFTVELTLHGSTPGAWLAVGVPRQSAD